jgi:hypothetical protein
MQERTVIFGFDSSKLARHGIGLRKLDGKPLEVAKRHQKLRNMNMLNRLMSVLDVALELIVAPDHHGYQRACDVINGQASNGPNGSPVFACAGKTAPPSRLILSQTSVGKGF